MSARFIDCPKFIAELYHGDVANIVPDLILDVDDPSEDEIIDRLRDCRFAVLDHSQLTRPILETCRQLRAIAFMGTGASNYIDLDAAKALGITVRTIRGYGDRSVAEHAVGLMFAAARQIGRMDRAIHEGRWATLDGIEIAGKTLGVVGTGGIGSEMVRLGASLGMNVLAWNRSGVRKDLPCEALDLDALLGRSDIVSLHLAACDETTHMIDRRRLSLLRPNAILINTARGSLIDETALVDALLAGQLRHAALDVFEAEPLAPGHPLAECDNVTLSGHAGFLTKEASARLLRMALEALAEERVRQGQS